MPVGPVEKAVAQIQSRGEYLDPEAAEETVQVLREMYGLDEGVVQQYISFWKRLFTGDFGPSLVSYPVPVSELIRQSLPWTFGLMLTTTVLVFIIGNISGGLAGYFTDSKVSENTRWCCDVRGPHTLLYRGSHTHHLVCLSPAHIPCWRGEHHRQYNHIFMDVDHRPSQTRLSPCTVFGGAGLGYNTSGHAYHRPGGQGRGLYKVRQNWGSQGTQYL